MDREACGSSTGTGTSSCGPKDSSSTAGRRSHSRATASRSPTPQGTFIYEVLAPAGHPVWRYDDPYRQMIRVHTKLIKRE